MDAECFQPQQILGDVRQYQQLAEQHEQRRLQLSHEAQQQQEHGTQQDGAAAGSLESIDPNTVHPDVWAAACLLGAKGTQLIKIYRELQDCRSVKHQQQPLGSAHIKLHHNNVSVMFSAVPELNAWLTVCNAAWQAGPDCAAMTAVHGWSLQCRPVELASFNPA